MAWKRQRSHPQRISIGTTKLNTPKYVQAATALFSAREHLDTAWIDLLPIAPTRGIPESPSPEYAAA
jgi:hypothetical protein